MNVVVEIQGREALPVWVLPYVTSWRLSPDMLLKRLSDPSYDTGSTFPTAFNLDMHGRPSPLPPAQWHEIEGLIARLEQDLTIQNLPEYDDRKAWKDRSIKEFWDYEPCYVWLDEFEKWYERFIRWGYISDKGESTELCFNPNLPKEHAYYFESTYAGVVKLTPKAALDKRDKDTQDTWVFNRGAPTMSLREFVDKLLTEAIGDTYTLPTFYELVEKYGLVVTDKVIEGQPIPPSKLLGALRKRERQADNAFDNGNFWEELRKESHYSVFRDDVAMAYERAGKTKFPWLNLDSAFIWLDVADDMSVPEFVSQGFGLAAKQDDYQEAIKCDSWTWQEALCWLKGRQPDNCRHHFLPRYYGPETGLIHRAIRVKKLTSDSTAPMQWIDWAMEKGWSVPQPLLDWRLQNCPYNSTENGKEGFTYPPDFLEKWQNKFGRAYQDNAEVDERYNRHLEKWAEIGGHERKIKELQLYRPQNVDEFLKQGEAIKAEQAKIDAIKKEIAS